MRAREPVKVRCARMIFNVSGEAILWGESGRPPGRGNQQHGPMRRFRVKCAEHESESHAGGRGCRATAGAPLQELGQPSDHCRRTGARSRADDLGGGTGQALRPRRWTAPRSGTRRMRHPPGLIRRPPSKVVIFLMCKIPRPKNDAMQLTL